MRSEDLGPAHNQLETRLIWLMVLRVIVVTTLLGSAVTVEVIAQPEGQVQPLYILIALTYLLTLLYALIWPFTESYRRQMAFALFPAPIPATVEASHYVLPSPL